MSPPKTFVTNLLSLNFGELHFQATMFFKSGKNAPIQWPLNGYKRNVAVIINGYTRTVPVIINDYKRTLAVIIKDYKRTVAIIINDYKAQLQWS